MANFKIGEKVVCLRCDDVLHYEEIIAGCKNPIPHNIYTIREIVNKDGRLGFRFEEIINPKLMYLNGFGECYYNSINYRKLDYDFAENLLAEISKAMKSETIKN